MHGRKCVRSLLLKLLFWPSRLIQYQQYDQISCLHLSNHKMHFIRKPKLLFVGSLLFLASTFIYYSGFLTQQRRKVVEGVCPIQVKSRWKKINGTFTNEIETPFPTMALPVESLDSFVMKQTIENFARPVSIFFSPKSVEGERSRKGHRSSEAPKSKDTEEFTIVMLTHNRTDVMLRLLQHLCGLPKLNQLLLIWNNPNPPGPQVHWPQVDYKIRVLTNGKNTMHNRFLPLSIVKTEAIFILDDDLFVVHGKVLEAFRIWQDNRDRIVGFHGRGVIFEPDSKSGTGGKWIYDKSPMPDSISLVLAGSAFIHRSFMELYTYEMPKGMRQIIDKTMNCDDLALNFLVSDRTQKGPIFVRHQEDFLCSGCTDTGLWTDPSHFTERDNCLNQFAEILGYMPLFKP